MSRLILSLPEIILHIRRKHHMSQTEFGKALGLSLPTITRIEKGRRTPSKELLNKIITTFNCNPDIFEADGGLNVVNNALSLPDSNSYPKPQPPIPISSTEQPTDLTTDELKLTVKALAQSLEAARKQTVSKQIQCNHDPGSIAQDNFEYKMLCLARLIKDTPAQAILQSLVDEQERIGRNTKGGLTCIEYGMRLNVLILHDALLAESDEAANELIESLQVYLRIAEGKKRDVRQIAHRVKQIVESGICDSSSDKKFRQTGTADG